MTIRKALMGIVLFVAQIALATYYSESIDLIVVAILAVPTLGYIIYKWVTNKYS